MHAACHINLSTPNTDISDQSLNDATDESYVLRVDAPVSFIQARTVFGALHALETFSQMVDRVDYKDLPQESRAALLPYFKQPAVDDDSLSVGSAPHAGQFGSREPLAHSARRLQTSTDAGGECLYACHWCITQPQLLCISPV